jgi:serine/threonine protein kinase
MAMSDGRWRAITESQYPWEREALDFVRQRLPDYEPYRAWANFEFIAEDGKIYEVDLLVITPKGFFLVEIKSRPGLLEGDSHTWTWTQDGKRHSYDSPLILADRKAKRLKSLIAKQKSCQKVRVPFLQPLVFCSADDLTIHLSAVARQGVFSHDRDPAPGESSPPGIVAAMTRWAAGAPDDPGDRRIDKPTAKALSRALEEAGIRPSQRARRVSDYVLGELLADGATYQEWAAEHCSVKGVRRRVRLYPLARGSSEAARESLQRAAEREFRILQGITHPGILRAEGFTVHERGPALIFDYDPKAIRLDHYLLQRGKDLGIDVRMNILRQIAEVLRYAHEKKLIHRALSPQCILILDPDSPSPRVQIFNWQTALREPGTTGGTPGVTGTAHPEQLVEDASLVYMAPEVIAGTEAAGEYADVFSLGAIALHLFAGRPPAESLLQRDQILRTSHGLDLSAVMDGVGKALRDLVQFSTYPEVANRLESVDDFLRELESVEEELTAPDEEPVRDPAEAKVNDRLPGDFRIKRRLGRGSCAVTFLVERGGAESVLKIAASTDHNERLRGEAEVLAKLRHERIVEFRGLVEVGDRADILMAKAGDQTLGQRLRLEGRLHVELLQRFGEELLQVVTYLEEEGIAHRDIKPDNIGLSVGTAKDRLHVVLFDFSLARTPAENIRAGTRPYLDPFLALRKPPRWDVHAERFAAAVTLYEMATATLPKWGDGQSDPGVIDAEANLDADLFDAELREPMTEFFRKALRRNVSDRFDTSEEMLRAWRRTFETAEPRQRVDVDADRVELAKALEDVTFDTQLALLPLSTRVLTAMERFNIVTVEELLQVPVMKMYGMRGVGNKTRREIRDLVASLSRRFPADEVPAPVVAEPGVAEEVTPERASVDLLLNRLLPAKGRVHASEEKAIRLLVGLDDIPAGGPNPLTPFPKREGGTGVSSSASPPGESWAGASSSPFPLREGGRGVRFPWPSQTDVAVACGLTRARIAQLVGRARQRWVKNPSFTTLREEIGALLDANGGVMTVRELAASVLTARGSVMREPMRSRAALAVTRAAVEAERERAESRFIVSRAGEVVFVARSIELADSAERLGRIADQLAAEDPLPSPRRVREVLEGGRPAVQSGMEIGRLVQLAAAASKSAAVSTRLEIYPRGMAAARAVKLAQGSLVGAQELTVDEVQERVRSRYPEAEKLPGRPQLDELLKDAGWDFIWAADAARGRGAYRPRLSVVATPTTGSATLNRYQTEGAPAEITPNVATARGFEERLQRALDTGAFLALTVRPKELRLADRVLSEHFPVERYSVEDLLLREMRAAADAAGVDWGLVLSADAAPPESKDWTNLCRLVGRALPKVEEHLRTAKRTLLLTYPGLLARYDRLELLEHLRDVVGRRDGLPGVWVLIPSDDQQAMPVIDGKPVPVITAGQWARIPDSWLRNVHRHRKGESVPSGPPFPLREGG